MRELSHEKRKLSKRWVIHRIQMLASLATIMKEKTALVTSMVYFALTIKGPPIDIYCIIEEPYKHYFTEKVSYSLFCFFNCLLDG